MINLKRVEENLKDFEKFSATPGNGCSRLAFSNEIKDAGYKLVELMEDANLTVTKDLCGNIFGIRKGKDSSKAAIVCGSHYDSVYNGGNFDGIAGVMSAIEIAKTLDENNINLERDYIVIAFMDEEGTRFGNGYFGSRAIMGEVSQDEINNFKDKSGMTLREAMENYGLDPDNIKDARWDDKKIGYFLELHIEQGPVLDQKKIELGIVNGIFGMQRYMIKVKGRADHAGTTPMNMRKDPMDIATKVIAKVADFAKETGEDTVATTGFISAKTGGMNIVASEVEFSLDIRSIDNDVVSEVYSKVTKLLDELTSKVGATYESRQTMDVKAAMMDEKLMDMMENIAEKKNYSYYVLPSGAGHDTMIIAKYHPTAMIFVPSINGRSHSPEEFTPYNYFEKAIDVLYELVISLE